MRRWALFSISLLLGSPYYGVAQTQPKQAQPTDKKTVYQFEAEEVSGKGTNNFFFKVGDLKSRKLLDLRKDFKFEMRESLDLLK